MSRFILISNLIFITTVLINGGLTLIVDGQSCTCPDTDEDLTSIRAVYVLMRHGIRAPWTTYPLDPFANDTTRFPNGRSQLTDAGIEQAYNLGKFLKKRYKKFMKNKQKQAFLRSSAAQRCIDSVSIVAKKLWPPEVDEEKSWQPMIFSLPKQIDSVLYEEPDCEQAEHEEQNNLKTQEVIDYESDPKIQELYNFTAEKTGLPPNMYSVTKAFDCIRCEKLNGLKSPEWATPEIYEQMGDVLSKRLNFFYKSTKAQRLRAGPILGDLKARLDTVINSKPEDQPKTVFIYGSHDFKIASVLNALGDPQPKYPPFAAAIIFELHRIGDQNIIRAQYMSQTINWPYSAINLPLTKCKRQGNPVELEPIEERTTKNLTEKIKSELSLFKTLSPVQLPELIGQTADQISVQKQECTFDNFVNSLADLSPVDWRTECGLDCKYDPFKAAEDNMGKT